MGKDIWFSAGVIGLGVAPVLLALFLIIHG